MWWRLKSPLRKLPGPPRRHWLYGNLGDIYDARKSMFLDEWAETYGPAVRFGGFLNSPTLFTLDTRALHHILTHCEIYQKSAYGRRSLSRILGEGLLVAEGERHKHQRKIMNPAFGPAQIRELTPMLIQKAMEVSFDLRRAWAHEASDHCPARINVLKGLSRVTLDAIGLAGFGHNIGALGSQQIGDNELAKAFEDIFDVPKRIPALTVLQTVFPILECLSNNIMRRFDHALSIMRRIGLQRIADKKASIAAELHEKDSVTCSSPRNRDLLTLLIKANMAPEGPRLSDEDVLAQFSTFLATGHESTSTATAWCLFALTQSPRVQEKLRDEALAVTTESPTMDELVALPYLDMVIRETLRLHPPIASTMRVATKDDVIPVSAPFTDIDGTVHSSIRVSEGTPILIPILAINTSRTLWGEDAHDFRPERWEDPPQPTANIPGVWAHTLSFLGGPRACIGYRLSLVEMKALVFTLVRAFEFSLAVDPCQVTKMPGILQRPLVTAGGDAASRLPLLVKRYTRREA
ncbi:hypothetical protein VTO73DRAFT_10012 [Trametes versicolor]